MNSLLEEIAQNVLTTLQGINTDNGYSVDLVIERAKRINEPRHLKGYIYQVSPDNDQSTATGTEQWTQGFVVVVYVMPPESDTTPIDVYNNEIAAAIHLELMKDYTRGNKALNTIIKPILFFAPLDGEYPGGISFQFDVLYRFQLDNPYQIVG